MVKSDVFFSRLVGIDTLFSCEGIIPSAADFQLKLISLIEQFNKTRRAEGQPESESEALCRAICCYFDRHLLTHSQSDMLSWQRYSLVNYFYGYSAESDENQPAAMLERLLNSESEVTFRYAWQLLMLFIQVETQTEALIRLRTHCRARYLYRPRPALTASSDSETWLPEDEFQLRSPRLMVFIIGPFASKWFSQSDLSTSNDNGIVWIVAGHANTLAKRLVHLKANQSHLATLAYFPLLADGLENSGLLIEQITAWQQALSATPLTGNLPCLLGLYSRLSQQRHSHDPERATWTGRLTTSGAGHLNLETCLIKLLAELDAVDDGSDLYAIQRQALGSMFVAWMAENRIMNVLQSLFDNSQLDLAGVTLADHSEGFSRHGAWSLWMQEKYGILPALSASTAMPPLPAIPLPAERDIPPFTAPLALTASGKRRRHWPAIAALLIMLLAAFTLHEYRQPVRTPLSALNPLRTFLPAPPRDGDARSFVLTDIVPLFKHGSSSMMPGSEKKLEEIASTLVQHPHQMFLIVGHTDSTGSPRANYALSTERAQMVKDWLVTKTGLPTTHFVVEGAGNMHPIASNETEEGRAQNRRVEIISLPVTSKRN